jgi:hypothetical protein
MEQNDPLTVLMRVLRHLGKKSLILAGAWVVVYFLSQPFNNGPMIFAEPILGAIAGAAAGWAMAEDAVEECGFSGPVLLVFLTLACWLPIWLVQGVMAELMHVLAGWEMTFGEWVFLGMATIFSLVAAMWRELVDD